MLSKAASTKKPECRSQTAKRYLKNLRGSEYHRYHKSDHTTAILVSPTKHQFWINRNASQIAKLASLYCKDAFFPIRRHLLAEKSYLRAIKQLNFLTFVSILERVRIFTVVSTVNPTSWVLARHKIWPSELCWKCRIFPFDAYRYYNLRYKEFDKPCCSPRWRPKALARSPGAYRECFTLIRPDLKITKTSVIMKKYRNAFVTYLWNRMNTPLTVLKSLGNGLGHYPTHTTQNLGHYQTLPF